MNTTQPSQASQLFFGLMSGLVPVAPITVGDVIVGRNFRRYVVETVSENLAGPVFVCVALDNGATCVVLDREVLYRSK